MTIVSAGAIASGAGVLTGALFGVAVSAATAAGQQVEVALDGVFSLPKVPATAISQGVLVYWDAANARVTNVSAGNTLIGHAHAAALAADATIAVRLQP